MKVERKCFIISISFCYILLTGSRIRTIFVFQMMKHRKWIQNFIADRCASHICKFIFLCKLFKVINTSESKCKWRCHILPYFVTLLRIWDMYTQHIYLLYMDGLNVTHKIWKTLTFWQRLILYPRICNTEPSSKTFIRWIFLH